MKRLFDFVYGNFMTLFDRVIVNIKELSPLFQVALALVAVALIFIAVMLLIYLIRFSKYRTIKEIENVDVVFFNSVYEFGPYTKAKEGEIIFILLIPFTHVINFVIKIFMFRAFSAINSSDYITRRMLENMQLENMRLKDKNKELLQRIDEAGLNKKPRKQTRPTPTQRPQEVKKETPKKVEPKVVKEEPASPVKEQTKDVPPQKEEVVKEEVKKEEPKKEAAPKVEEPKVTKEATTSSTLVTEEDKEPEVILSTQKVEDPIMPEREILEAEIIDPEKDKLDEIIELASTKETRGKA